MRLRTIKLSGFKSFVDPTTLVVPDNLVGIVGPNGCGKSNIIDAVTWVMGESSAKYLRGESLTDVIFNGSGARQPVGQATVELVFDNSRHTLGGRYASYSELSVKRQINREGISTYFLNGARCRRKDIQGLFLGTGLGPRSYAIIEQGVISRLIDARPEELRMFVEEAAGISRFRERRRETENRIRHTRENLERLNDIREELGRQLVHLQRQARAAERYQVLRQAERQTKAQLLAINWRDLNAQQDRRLSDVSDHETRVQSAIAALRSVEAEIERLRDGHSTASDEFNRLQSEFYAVGSDISQQEQKIQHAEERIKSLQTDIADAESSRAEASAQQQRDRAELEQLTTKAQSLEPQLAGSRNQSDAAYSALDQAENAMQTWQAEWDAFNEASAEFTRQLEVDRTRQEHIEADIEELLQRRQTLTRELEKIESTTQSQDSETLAGEITELEQQLTGFRRQLDDARSSSRAGKQELDVTEHTLAGLRDQRQSLVADIASLRALARRDAGEEGDSQAWLEAAGLADCQPLASDIQVDPEWVLAVETVLDRRLDFRQVPSVDATLKHADQLVIGSIGVIESGPPPPPARLDQSRLSKRVRGNSAVNELLRDVYIAETLDDALRLRGKLKSTESIVTRDGVWIGRTWAYLNRPADERTGAMSRQRELRNLQQQQRLIDSEYEAACEHQQHLRKQVQTLDERQRQLQTEIDGLMQRVAAMQAEQAKLETMRIESERRLQQIRDELAETDEQEVDDRSDLAAINARLAQVHDDRESLDQQRQNMIRLRNEHKQALDDARARWQSTHEKSHAIALQLQSISSKRAALEQALQRSDIQIRNLDLRIADLNRSLHDTRQPLQTAQTCLEQKLVERVDAERRLAAGRARLATIDTQLRDAETSRAEAGEQVQRRREDLEKARLAAQELKVRLQTIEEQLENAGQIAATIIEELDTTATAEAWQEKLAGYERKIQRLGAINLAAIDEYNQLSDRKEYLDRQNEDLTSALSTLESAIRKIDRETRTRFKETFDKLNDNLKGMFPVLFGGGHAYLQMTGDDLLDTGVSLMARPPGKRNTSIHLLSGGEKALTAVALVFAIFKLNPAPFCILDEVDAPLDDANVGRFCKLLKEMSTDVQFVFITHNKITMEIASQLLGVTMNEPGVSRLVSVDMDEATDMAASA